MKTISRCVAAAAVLTLGLAAHASAEPIVITGGSMLVTGQVEVGSITLTGTRGFTLRALVDPSEGQVSAISQCGQAAECFGGTTVNIGTFIGGFGFPRGVVTLDGATFDDIDNANSPANLNLQLAGTVTLPAVQLTPLVITAPFTIGGESAFFPPFPGDPVAITGSGGTATLRLAPAFEVPEGERPWVLDEILYDFGGAAPVPEPATVLLAGMSVAAAVWRKRRADGRSTASRLP
jgi:hypothetical protein